MRNPDFRLAWWQLRGQSSRAWLFILCVALGVSARVSVGSFMGAVSRAVNREARSLLAADLEAAGTRPLTATELADLRREAGPGARLQQKAAFLSVLSSGTGAQARSRLCQVGAVQPGYPFYGKLRLRLEDGSETNDAGILDSPEPMILLAPELLAQLGVRPGGRVKAGRLSFRVAGVVLEEPGLGGGAFSLGPRVMMGLRHLKATGLAEFGSRVNYATLVALKTPEEAVGLSRRLAALWKLKSDPAMPGPPPTDSLRLRTFRDAEGNLQRFFERLADFLNLASLMALLLGGIGIASVARAFVRERQGDLGVLRSLGASAGRLARITLIQCLALGLLGSLLGALAGTAIQGLLPWMLKDFLPLALDFAPDFKSCGIGVGLGLLTTLVFSLLPIAEIRKAKPAQLFRDEPLPGAGGWAFWSLALSGALIFTLAGSWEAHSFLRGGGFIGALIAGACLIWLGASALLPLLARLRPRHVGLRHGLSNLARPGLRPTASVVALGCAALHLGVLAVYQGSLLRELDPARRASEIPGLFLIDVQEDQADPLKAWIESQGPFKAAFSPMVKARYRGKNGEAQAAGEAAWSREGETDGQMRNREQNLSYRPALSEGETLVEGAWMKPGGEEVEASLEEWFAKRLGVKLGDRLEFDVQGVRLEARVSSLRKVHWASFQPNFFILLSPWALKDAPKVFIASVTGTTGEAGMRLQSGIVDKFPNVTVFDVAEGAKKITGIMNKISWAVRVVALFSLATGLVVLAGIALATARARKNEAALLKALGAGRATVLGSLGAEFAALGLVSAFLGLGLSALFGWILMERVLDIPFRMPWAELAALGLGLTALCAATGMLSALPAIRAKPLAVLREE